MFTGIVEELGTAVDVGARLTVACRAVIEDSDVAASVAVNGVCLTVVARELDLLSFDLSPETLARTSLGSLAPGDPVNLERSATLATRLGGHLVQGHVDGVGYISDVRDAAAGKEMRVSLPDGLARYVVEKGSITVDGVSLTVTDIIDGEFGVALIPFTLEATTLGTAKVGDRVNLEVDVLAKYVEGLMRETT
jgi:riboflavin synthase